jgi:hypothetical protein
MERDRDIYPFRFDPRGLDQGVVRREPAGRIGCGWIAGKMERLTSTTSEVDGPSIT